MQIATKSLVLALLCAPYCTSTNARLVDLRGTSWEKHSQKECGLDPYLLYAVALTESKNNAGTKGYVVPSPWALNNYVYGSYYPTSYEDAKRALARYLSATPVTDIGIVQINFRWNGQYVNHPEELLDVDTNIRIGAKTLCAAIKANPGDIELAIGGYNTQNPKLEGKAREYGQRVLRVWKRLIEND